jgi:hypothetical protein
MVNFDPDTAERDSEVMKTVVRMNDNYAGVYSTVVRAGELRVGQVVTLEGPAMTERAQPSPDALWLTRSDAP